MAIYDVHQIENCCCVWFGSQMLMVYGKELCIGRSLES